MIKPQYSILNLIISLASCKHYRESDIYIFYVYMTAYHHSGIGLVGKQVDSPGNAVQVQVQVLYWHIYIIKTQMTIDIAYKHTKCFGYNRDHTDNTLGLYVYANGTRNHEWFMSPWVHIRNNEI